MQFLGIGFLVLLFMEIMSIVWMVGRVGGGISLLLIIISFFCGTFMLRNTGLSGVLLAAAAMKNGGRVSVYQMLWPLRYTLAAVCLMSPGFVSTVLALLLLLPIKGGASVQAGKAEEMFGGRPFSNRASYDDEDIIEGEYTVKNPGQDEARHYIEHKKD